MRTINRMKTLSIIALASIWSFFSACSDDYSKESISEDDYPRIVATKPTFPSRGENGELGVFNVSTKDTLSVKVLYTPYKYVKAVWYIDGVEVATGDELRYHNENAGIHHLKLVLSTANYETTREVNVNVYATSSGGEFSGFEINKGVNIGIWLSQSALRGDERRNRFKESDVLFLSQQGFDHLRLPVDEVQLFKESGEIDEETMALVTQTANWCQQYNMKLIFDFHVLRSHDFGSDNRPLWTDTSEQTKLIEMWKTIHNRLLHYPDNLLAYELLNEPVAPDNGTWNTLLNRLVTELRKVAPSRMLIIGSNLWNSFTTMQDVQIPANDPNIMLTVHYYEPYLLTHYRASWTDFANLNLPLTYPGLLISDNDFNNLSSAQQDMVRPYKKEYTRESILNDINVAATAAKAKGVKLYCGEFGCLPFSNLGSRYAWYRDMVSIFNETQTAYAAWEYNSIFGFCTEEGALKDAALVDILTGRESGQLTTIYSIEAEDCVLDGGLMVIQDNGSASGGKHVNQFWGESTIKFNVTATEAGEYYLRTRYVCGIDVWMYVQVNGGLKQMIPCPSSGDWWSGFTTVETKVNLSVGENSIILSPEPAGSPILDKFEICQIVR